MIEFLYRIFEMAEFSKEIKSQIRSLTPNIVTHLYKIYGFGECNETTTIHHWVAEISADLRSFCYIQCKHSHKPLTTKEIIDVMKDKYRDAGELASVESSLFKEYGYSKYTNKELYDKIYSILPKLIEYIKSLDKDTERPDLNFMEELIKGD